MSSLVWAITCQRIIVDNASNTVTYVDAVEEIQVPEVPFACTMAVGMLWHRDVAGERIRTRVLVTGPSDIPPIRLEGDLDHPSAMYHRVNLNIVFPCVTPGIH